MASEKASGKDRPAWTPDINHKLFLALLDASSIDYAAIAERLGQGHTRDTVYQRIYNLKNGRVKNFVMSTPGSNTSPTKKRKMDTESNEKSD